MSNIETYIKVGLSCLSEDYDYIETSSDYNLVYARTNEEIDTYFSRLPINNGIIATVAGSGDQQLQIAKNNPKEIHVFDKNPLAIQMAKLKTASCLALTYERFKSFTSGKKNIRYCKKDYKVIRELLDEDAKRFWDAMYNEGKFNQRYENLIQKEFDDDINRGPNSYETEENFYKTKSNLEKIAIYYYYAEFYKFFSQIVKDKKFDAIFLSNIYDWLFNENRQDYPDFIKKELDKLLTDKGMIAVYSPVKKSSHQTKLEEVDKESFKMIDRDKILIYRKNRE